MLFLGAVALYIRVFRHPFVNFDDTVYITENPHVQAGMKWETVKWAATSFAAGNWHPLTWLAHAMNFQIFGLAAGGHHAVSVLLHGVNAGLLYLLLVGSTGARWRSAIVAALFAAHPLNVESVAWAAELKTVLCTLFFFLALGAYGWYAQKPEAKRYGLIALLFALALASKPMAITLPFALLLVDFWPLRRVQGWTTPDAKSGAAQKPFPSLLLEKAPLLLLSAASAVVTIVAQQSVGTVVPVGVVRAGAAPTDIAPISLSLRSQNAAISYLAYLGKAAWPLRLAPFYPYSFRPRPAWELILVAGLLAFVSLGAWKARREHPYVVAGWLWYLGTLVPMIGLVQVGSQAMADRYMYVPLVGIFVMLVWGAADLVPWKGLHPVATLVPAGIVLALLTGLTWRQEGFWRSSYDLWSCDLEVAGSNSVAEHNISSDLMFQEKWAEGLGHLQRAVALDPTDAVARIDLAVALQNLGHYAESLQQYAVALQQTSDPKLLPTVYENVGNIYYHQGEFAKGEESYLRALRLSPGQVNVVARLNHLRRDRQIHSFAQDVASHPTADGYFRLGRMLSEANWIPQARYSYQKALQINPSLEEARAALAALPAERSAP